MEWYSSIDARLLENEGGLHDEGHQHTDATSCNHNVPELLNIALCQLGKLSKIDPDTFCHKHVKLSFVFHSNIKLDTWRTSIFTP